MLAFPTCRISVSSVIQAAMLLLAAQYQSPVARAQTDPGPRGGPPAAGAPVPGLSPALTAVFNQGLANFKETENVSNGLGPRFNSNSCLSCHVFPAPGGSSPPFNPLYQFMNSQNRMPNFMAPNGPIREVRFVNNPNGTPDGGVHNLFTIGGRFDTPSGCNLAPTDFSNTGNLAFRIPTPTYGLGLIEAIPDSTLVQNLASNIALASSQISGVSGRLNRNGNDGSVTRFGWKAQNKSLLIFSGEAYNVEMGVTNFVFNSERDETPNCSPTHSPNSIFNVGGFQDQAVFDDVTNFANFMRFLAPPARGPIDGTVLQGSNQFVSIGCARCHTVTLQTGQSQFSQLANQQIHPYSDFAIHNMGPGLADQISQGLAGGDEFRTAPLWGLGQRLFFLHDGRETDLPKVIADHASPGNSQFRASEANMVVQNFNALSRSDKQAILNFLRSL